MHWSNYMNTLLLLQNPWNLVWRKNCCRREFKMTIKCYFAIKCFRFRSATSVWVYLQKGRVNEIFSLFFFFKVWCKPMQRCSESIWKIWRDKNTSFSTIVDSFQPWVRHKLINFPWANELPDGLLSENNNNASSLGVNFGKSYFSDIQKCSIQNIG